MSGSRNTSAAESLGWGGVSHGSHTFEPQPSIQDIGLGRRPEARVWGPHPTLEVTLSHAKRSTGVLSALWNRQSSETFLLPFPFPNSGAHLCCTVTWIKYQPWLYP